MPFGDKVPPGGGFLPERYLIRGQKYPPWRPCGISSRKLMRFGDKVPSGGGFLPERYLIRGQKYLLGRPCGISSRKLMRFGDKVPPPGVGFSRKDTLFQCFNPLLDALRGCSIEEFPIFPVYSRVCSLEIIYSPLNITAA